MMLLLRIRFQSARNFIASLDNWEVAKRAVFSAAGFAILVGIYFGFKRLLGYLETVQLIGPLLVWKLTSMSLLTTFSMIAISGLITAMTTLYYSYDLKFLISSPLPMRVLFLEKSVETAVYSSWTLALALVPFIMALGAVLSAPLSFYFSFMALLLPFVFLAAAFGIVLSLALMRFFPTSRTRDAVWMLSSLALALVYVLIRFSEPEKLIRPDALQLVAQYLQYLQAPSLPWLPPSWVAGAMKSFVFGKWKVFWGYAGLLFSSAILLYGAMAYVSEKVYLDGFSGAQEGRMRNKGRFRAGERNKFFSGVLWILYRRDKKLIFRDARYLSQMVLILALMAVYLFSIRQLPLDTPDLKSLVSFLNIAVAGFVVAALGLRFTFPAVSLEGKSFWILKSAPLSLERVLMEKLVLYALPAVALGILLVGWSNYILGADRFISVLSVATIAVCSFALSVMGVGLGAFFPKFQVENIHQIESSAGGFIYMACSLGYLGATVALLALPVQMHFYGRFGRPDAWDWPMLGYAGAGLVILNAVAVMLPWKLGLNALEKIEI